MAFFFPAPFSDQILYFRRSVEGLKAGGSWADAYLQGAIMALLAVEVAALRDRTAPDAVETFRREAAEALTPLATLVGYFVETVADEAQIDDPDAWEGLCGKRSAIQVLLTRYAGTPGVARIDPDDLRRLDEGMRRVGRDLGPTRPDFRLPGLPASHWWWWYPDPPPASAKPHLPLLAMIDHALQMTEDRLARTPAGTSVHAMFGSIRAQLRFMRDTAAAGLTPTPETKNRLTLGVIAIREFETTDPEYADALTAAVHRFRSG